MLTKLDSKACGEKLSPPLSFLTLALDTISDMSRDFGVPPLSNYYVVSVILSKLQTALRYAASPSPSLGLTLALGWGYQWAASLLPA